MPSYIEGFRKRLAQDYGWDIQMRVFRQPIHITTTTSWLNQPVTVYFAIYRGGRRIELASYVTFEHVGSRKHIGLATIEDRWYAFDYEGESGRLFECVES